MRGIKLALLPLFLFGLMWLSSSTSSAEPQLSPPSIISLQRVAGGFTAPTGVTSTGIAGDGRLFVIEKTGAIKIIQDGVVLDQLFLNLQGQVSLESERGLLGLAFDPSYATNGYFYINYSDNRSGTKGDTIIKRYSVSENPNVADAASGVTILEIEQDFRNHNGGWLAFDPDGQLVIGMGDGGSGGDPNNRAQSRNTLLGKMVRINVHGNGLPPTNGCGRVQNYTIPEDNPRPFGADGWCSEIWSYGWRNPWRFSFDASTGDMWAGDVGQNAQEEIDFEPRGSAALQNFGWNCYEGFPVYGPANCTLNSADRTDPVADYGRSQGTSVTGGYVYRGSAFPDMQGHYFYGDFASGRLWSIEKDSGFAVTEHDKTPHSISSFGEGSDNELYLVDYGGGAVYRVVSQFGAQVELAASGLAEVGGPIVYTLTVTNLGTDVLTNVSVQNSVPFGATYSSGGSESAGIVTVPVGDVSPGESKSVIWQATSGSTGTVSNTTFSVQAQEVNGPISGRTGANQMTLVVDELQHIYLPIAIRDN